MATYRIIVGETGNEVGHIIDTTATSIVSARRILVRELAKYRGDGWGYIEADLYDDNRWQRIDDTWEEV